MLFLIVGLGNPGDAYRQNRHNLGFRVVEVLAERRGIAWGKTRFSSAAAMGSIAGRRVLLLKPQTFMNRSGESLGAASRFFQVPVGNIALVHDDVDLTLGRIQVRQGGGHGGHRGLMSVLEALGDDSFVRVRVGVNRPEAEKETADHVLSAFQPEERSVVDDAVERAASAVETWLQDGLTTAMNRYNPWPGKVEKE